MKQKIRKYFKYLEVNDFGNQVFLLLLSFIILINKNKIDYWYLLILLNLFFAFSIIFIVNAYESMSGLERTKQGLKRFLRFWYPVFVITFCFKQIYVIMLAMAPVYHDEILINIDRTIFGTDPTVFLEHYSNPVVTELLQVIYGVFYFMPVIYGVELYVWHRYKEYKYATFVIFTGFYLSFLGYLILPAIGPRFTLHNFANINFELPGLYLTDIVRDLVNYGESIYPKGVANPELIAQRDAFPSGHTIIIVLITYMSRKFKSNTFYFYLPYAVLMIFATVYLRYHYVIDLIAGFGVALLTIAISEYLFRNRFKNI